MLSLPVFPAFEKNNLAITMQTSDFYAPYASVTALSIIEHASPAYNYDIIFMTWDMEEETERKLISMAEGRPNVSVRVVDVSEEIKPYRQIMEEKYTWNNRFSFVGVTRLALPELLPAYDLVLNFDCDMLICADVAELFQYDLTGWCMGGVTDVYVYAVRASDPVERTSEAKNMVGQYLPADLRDYFNGGMLMLNLKKIRAEYTEKDILDFAVSEGYMWRCFEQDTFSGLFAGKILSLPVEYDWFVDPINLVANSRRSMPANDAVLKDYYDAEDRAKIYHYVSVKKPWDHAEIAHSDKWWNTAIRSPFLSEILARTVAKDGEVAAGGKDRYLLFFCETEYQLLNLLDIKYHYYRDIPADMIMSQTTNIKQYKDAVEKTGLFERIIVSEYHGKDDVKRICEMSEYDRTKHPEKYEKMVSLNKDYSDYFIPTASFPYAKMIYYWLVNRGVIPSVYIYEEGTTTYVDDLYAKLRVDINHTLYPEELRLPYHIRGIFLHQPEMYCGRSNVPKLVIPALRADETQFKDLLQGIFGQFHLPEEKYLFFNEPFEDDGLACNDLEILDRVAEIVGKSNIAVKMHPRAAGKEALYRLHGYQIFSEKDTPWEMAVFAPEIKDKVLLAVSSNVIWTPFVVGGANGVRSIFLQGIMKLSRRLGINDRNFPAFKNKLETKINKTEILLYHPGSLMELLNIIQYIEGEAR